MNNEELAEFRMPVLERTADERIKELEGFNFGLATESQEQQKRIKELEADNKKLLSDLQFMVEKAADKSLPAYREQQERIKKLEKEKKVIYCEAIALLTQVNGSPMEVAVAHDYLTKVYEASK